MHPVYILAFVTFACVIAFGVWNFVSTRSHQKHGGNTSGVGGPNDPMAGATEGIRDPEEMRASMDAAAKQRQ